MDNGEPFAAAVGTLLRLGLLAGEVAAHVYRCYL